MTKNAASTNSDRKTDGPLILEIEREFSIGCEQLFDCFVDAGHIANWFGPIGTRSVSTEFDPQVGGRYRFEIENPDGSRVAVGGEIITFERPSRLRMTWAWEHLQGGPMGEESLVHH